MGDTIYIAVEIDGRIVFVKVGKPSVASPDLSSHELIIDALQTAVGSVVGLFTRWQQAADRSTPKLTAYLDRGPAQDRCCCLCDVLTPEAILARPGLAERIAPIRGMLIESWKRDAERTASAIGKVERAMLVADRG